MRTISVERVVDVISADVDAGLLPGAVLVIDTGEFVEVLCFGYSDPISRAPVLADNLFWLASLTKPVTAVGVLALVDDGALSLDDAVKNYLPEIAGMKVGVSGQPPQRDVTVRDLLMHTSGIIEGSLGDSPVHLLYFQALRNGITGFSAAEYLSVVGELPLLHQPGDYWHYGFGFDLAGQIIERVSGSSLSDFLESRVFGPLGMRDTGFGLATGDQWRFAAGFDEDPLTLRPSRLPNLQVLGFDAGGSGLVSTAPDFARFGRMLLSEGRRGDQHVLRTGSVRALVENRLPAHTRGGPVDVNPLLGGYGFGLGVAVGPDGDYTWSGYSGAHWWNDPNRDLCVVWLAHTPSEMRYRYRAVLKELI